MSASHGELQNFRHKQNPKTSHVSFEHWRDSDRDALDRLAEWRRRRVGAANERERRMVAEVLVRRDLGQELSERNLAVIVNSPCGTAAGGGRLGEAIGVRGVYKYTQNA